MNLTKAKEEINKIKLRRKGPELYMKEYKIKRN